MICLTKDCTGMSICKSFDVWTFISAIFWIINRQVETCCQAYLVYQPKMKTVLDNCGSLLESWKWAVGGGLPPQKNNFLAVSKVSNVLAYRSNASVDSLAFHHFGTEQGGISWRNHPVSKIWIVVYWKKVSRDWSDCCTLYKISNQWNYGSTALLGWKRSNVLFSPCTSSDVAFIRLG